jgi:hypothetical protein
MPVLKWALVEVERNATSASIRALERGLDAHSEHHLLGIAHVAFEVGHPLSNPAPRIDIYGRCDRRNLRLIDNLTEEMSQILTLWKETASNSPLQFARSVM